MKDGSAVTDSAKTPSPSDSLDTSTPYNPSQSSSQWKKVAVTAVAVPLLVGGFLYLTAKGEKAPFRFSSRGLVDKKEFNDYLSQGALHTTTTLKFKQPIEKVWNAFAGEGAFDWVPLVKGVRYVGVPGEGAVRYLSTLPLAVGEQVVEYEEGKILGYTSIGGSLPLIKSLASQYVFSPTKKGGTQFVWSFATTPKFVGFVPLQWASPLLKVGLRLFANGAKKKIRQEARLTH